MPKQPKRKTGSSMQVSVRLPLAVYDVLVARKVPIAGYVVDCVRAALVAEGALPETWAPASDTSRLVRP